MAICASCGHWNPEGARFCNACAASLDAALAEREQRKTVSIVFCDITGSTELGESTDPEAVRSLLARYFERMKGIVESHGGSVEKFIGDAVMAVFGVPVAHEDDALRACRAAAEMRDALPELGIAGRIGVNTGEVVTGTEERLATGDAVNVAARLEQAAQPGEVLVGAETLVLVRLVVEVGEARLLELKGKGEPVAAYPLLRVFAELERRFATLMVGRRNELGRLQNVFAQALHDRSCQLFTLLGSAGVGKSRLAAEFLAGLEARVVRGRCLSYGEGITYWPVVEILKQLDALPEGDAARPLRSLLGDTEEPASAEEIAWGFRKLLEEGAQAEPLVVVFDDLHWAEETLFDLVEHVADLSRGAPILLLCIARPELLERRSSWGGGKWNATTVLLEPLDATEAEALLGELGGVRDGLRERIVQVAEGNPLFLEEMLALVRDSAGDEVEVPPTIQALLAARLDQLEPPEREVLQCGAVEGRLFHRGAVQALLLGETQVATRLTALVRKELVRPERAELPGEEAFRFRHLLIRDAAYDALPKAERADLHERFALWLEEHGADLVELDEILGYHLEQAWAYRRELGQDADERLAAKARDRLVAAGHRALLHIDTDGAVKLFERASALMPDRLDRNLESDLIGALFEAGRGEEARSRAQLLAERAAADRDEVSELVGRLWEDICCVLFMPEGATDRLAQKLEHALPLFQTVGDDGALYVAWSASLWVAHMQGRIDAELDAAEKALASARRLGSAYLERGLLPFLTSARGNGTTRVEDTLAWLELLPEQDARAPSVRQLRALMLADLGHLEEAREVADALRAELLDRGAHTQLALLEGFVASQIEVLAGDPASAAARGEESCRIFEEMDEHSWLSTVAGLVAQAHYELDRLDEAERWANRARELGASDDAATQMLWRQVRAKILARRGDPLQAERLVREAVTIGGETDMLDAQGNSHSDLAEVLEAAGRREEAVAAWHEALARYERKGIIPLARRVRERLAEVQPAEA